jgi:hypothetical protein
VPPRKKPPPHLTDELTVAALDAEAAEEARRATLPPSPDLPPSAVMARLADVKVQELDGRWMTLGAIWESSPAALVFLRHYG